MGWKKEGKFVVPDGNSDPGTSEVDGEQVTPSGLIVKAEPREAQRPSGAQIREVKRLMKRMTKKQKKEEHKKFLVDRFGYLKVPIVKPKPKKVHTSENKGE